MAESLFLPPISLRALVRLADRVVEIKLAQHAGTATEDMAAELLAIRDRLARLRAYTLGLLSLSAAKGAQS